MNRQSPKSRVVVFRLTEVEYALLKKACSRARRSLSGFARSELLSRLKEDALKRGEPQQLRKFEEQLSGLQTSLADLKELILCVLPEARDLREGGPRSS